MTPRLGSDKFLLTFYFEIYISEGQLKCTHGIKLPKKMRDIFTTNLLILLAIIQSYIR